MLPSFSSISSQEYDLAIIGGGINGIAVARDAALRGLSVILLEQGDFACGASSKTSKLLHGGLRYLEQRQFRLVKECLRERDLLIKNAPCHAKILPFVFPVYEKDPHPLWEVKLGLYLYDLLDWKGKTPSHRNMTEQEILALFPNLKQSQLKGGCLYYDALMLDSRLLFTLARDAERAGAKIINYTSVSGFIKKQEKIEGITFHSKHQKGTLHAKMVVNATGSWSQHLLDADHQPIPFQLKPSKGVHLVLPSLQNHYALILTAPQDKRVFFLIPWEGCSLLGTTDTFYDGDPNHVTVSIEDEDYLLAALAHYFPQLGLTRTSIIASFAGLRPLVSFKQSSPSAVSRDYILHTSPSGLITLLGGKYTTHRLLAEKTVDHVLRLLNKPWVPTKTKDNPIDLKELPQLSIESSTVSHENIQRLFSLYGEDAQSILKRIKEFPGEGTPLCSMHPHLIGELRYSILHEQARTLEDWFCRRTSIAYTPCKGRHCVLKTARVFASLLQWSVKEEECGINEWISRITSD